MNKDENKEKKGKSQIYSDENSRFGMQLESRRSSQGKTVKDQEKSADSRRRREQENAQKVKVLSAVLGVLIVLLIISIVYEIILGHGIKTTGSERMAQQSQPAVEIISEDTAEIIEETEA